MRSNAVWEDPIVDEVRQVREAHAARFRHDLQAIFRDIKQQEQESGRTFVSYPARRARSSEKAGPVRRESLRQISAPGPMTREYRISLWCGALPLAWGASIFALWYLTRAGFLTEAGLVTLAGGCLLFVVGMINLWRHLLWEYRLGIVSRRRLLRQGLLSGGLLLSNFPAAVAIIVAAVSVATAYTVRVQNQSGQVVSDCRVTGGGVTEELGTLRAGEPAVRRVWFSTDGTLGFEARLGHQSLDGTIEGYVTSSLGGDTTVTIQPNGSIAVNRRRNDD
jgi:hypothetical protein